ncbi:hypothetical protein MmiEs2_15820 [Methanimicrococcus stummii]|uniref:Uncharacterized protein n=2 Tax=Methanimicrococcus stummii TaxID=3028294 RepID=A0AA96VBN4_9EURY|nr:hypothetical protein MmiEs2_15820 [Methanimicrococcus sp. Es2]
MSEFLRPTGRIIEFTPQEMEEIEKEIVYAEEMLDKEIERLNEKYKNED